MIKVLQTSALPLGYVANNRYYSDGLILKQDWLARWRGLHHNKAMTGEQPRPTDSEQDDLRFAPSVTDSEAQADNLDKPEAEDNSEIVTPEVDLDAALAAISALDDILAEQEAAEQAEIVRQQAETQARAEREARLQNPELFFPMPSMTTMQRGRLDSVIPALVCIGVGAWLTFMLTSGGGVLSPTILILTVCGGLGITLIARWLASGRWAVGTLFFGLLVLLTGGILVYLLSEARIITHWPLLLAAPGLAFFVTGVLNSENKWMLPGILLIAGGLASLSVTSGMLPDSLLTVLAGLWPIAVFIVLLMILMSLIFSRQRE